MSTLLYGPYTSDGSKNQLRVTAICAAKTTIFMESPVQTILVHMHIMFLMSICMGFSEGGAAFNFKYKAACKLVWTPAFSSLAGPTQAYLGVAAPMLAHSSSWWKSTLQSRQSSL
eukprot:5177223-Amphidinium_carterae.3